MPDCSRDVTKRQTLFETFYKMHDTETSNGSFFDKLQAYDLIDWQKTIKIQ